MVRGGPVRARQGREEKELNHSHEWEGIQESGRDGVKKHGRALIRADEV